MKPLIALMALLPTVGMADSVAPWPVNTRIQNIISAVGPNWNGSGNYKAVLIREGEFAALYIFQGPYDQRPLAYAPRAAITGEYWGAVPWLEFDESGALLLHSENHAFGRNKWESTLTIVERKDRFIVSAFSRSSYDSLNPDDYTDCEIDLLEQVLTVNGVVITPYPLPAQVEVKTWSDVMEDACYPQ